MLGRMRAACRPLPWLTFWATYLTLGCHLQRVLTFPAHVPGVQYWFTVLAKNTAGFGPEVTPRIAFMPPTV